MNKINFSLPTSLGEIINIKYHLDIVKSGYSEIKLSFKKSLWDSCLHTEAPDWEYKKSLWNKYLFDIGQLFFSEAPYVMVDEEFFMYDAGRLLDKLHMRPQKTEMANLLCAGEPLNLDEEYIVITTKVRQLNKTTFYPLSSQLWATLKELSKKYKIVILGEKVVEMRKEYATHDVFGIYEQIIANIPSDRILDLTVPALGETVSDLTNIRQDCLIMNQAKFVITIGIGGNFCMATSVAKMAIGFRDDDLPFTNIIFQNREYPNAIVTKDWGHFINVLKRYM